MITTKGVWSFYAWLIDWKTLLWPYDQLLAEIAEALDLKPGEILLDAGCGTANVSQYLGEKAGGKIQVIGLDFSAKMIERAKNKCPWQGFCFSLADLNQALPFADSSFDAVISCHVLYNLAQPAQALEELRRVLKPAARLVLVTPQTNNPVNVLTEHCKHIWQKKDWRRLVKTLLCFPFLLGLAFYNVLLAWQSQSNQDHFFREEALKTLLADCGFRQIETRVTYAKVDILAIARK